jgi:non-heme chloroperoxidase
VRIAGAAVAIASCLLLSAQSARDPIKHVSIDGEDFAYVEAGRGDPLVLVHGGLQDYRLWREHISAFAQRYRVIAYSRRNHFPNAVSAEGTPDNAGDLHGKDLAALIAALGLTRPHLVGHSSGALTVLFFAASHPGVARTLVLNEPNAISLLAEAPDGAAAMREFTERFGAARDAFRQRQIDRALPLWADAVSGPGSWARRSEVDRRMNADNALANVADQTTSRPRTPFTCEMAQRIATPTLLTTGERSPTFFHHIVDVLERCLPTRERISIARASHTVPAENPGAYRRAVLAFLAKR